MMAKNPGADTGKPSKHESMAVEISELSGKVIVRKGDQDPHDAKPGMTFTGRGKLLIATAENSSALLLVKGESIRLGAKSVFLVRGGDALQKVHGKPWNGTAKKWVGKVWAWLSGEKEPKDDGSNVAVGVRG